MSMRQSYMFVAASVALMMSISPPLRAAPDANKSGSLSSRNVQTIPAASEDDLASFAAVLNGRLAAITNSATFDASGRVSTIQRDGETLTALYDGEKLVAVRVGKRVLKLDVATSERAGQVGALVVSADDGQVLDVVKRFAPVVGRDRPQSQVFVLNTQSIEQLQAGLAAQASADRSAIRDFAKAKVCANNIDCDASRFMYDAKGDLGYEQEMVIADLVRGAGGIKGSADTSTLVMGAMLASRASDNKYRCTVRSVSNWSSCMASC